MTAYLSCTSKYAVAEYYLKTQRNLSLEETQRRKDADALMFEFRIDDSTLKTVGNGLYLYSYQRNYKRGKMILSYTDLKSTV